MNPEPLVLPDTAVPDNATDTARLWGPWLDKSKSTPPVKKVVKQPMPVADKKREINLKVTLIGVFGGKKNGVAIMGVGGSNQQVFVVGDTVKDDIVLSEVRIGSILLSVDDTEKEYLLPVSDAIIARSDSDSKNTSLPEPTVIQQIDQPKIQTVNRPRLQQKNPQQVQQQRPVSSKVRKKISEVKQQIQEQPLKAAGLGNFELTKVDGELGIKVKSFKYRDVLIGLGLRPNDIVLAVNGTSIQELTRNPNLANGLLKENNFQVSIIRNGKSLLVPIQW